MGRPTAMANVHQSALLVIITLCFPGCALGSRILLLPAQQVSHVIEQVAFGEVLVERGHQVYILLDSTYPKVSPVEQAGITPIFYEEPEGAQSLHTLSQRMAASSFSGQAPVDYSGGLQFISKALIGVCDRILHNARLLERLRSMELDMVVVDGFLVQPCLFLLPFNLTVPFIYQFRFAPDLAIGNPTLPSFCVTDLSTYRPPMSLYHKLRNIYHHYVINSIYDVASDQAMIAEFAPGVNSIWDVIGSSELFIVTRDHILEGATTTLPNIILLPGITQKEAQTLPADISSIMSGSSKVVVLSFGSSIDDIPRHVVERLLHAMASLPKVTFLVRVSENAIRAIKRIPSNVKAMGWLPQNDVLAHPNTKLFITHCGNNGQYEAVYHGVPMIGFPLFGEQPHNCMRMETRGLGLCVNIHSFSPAELTNNIVKMLGNKTFRDNVTKLSRIMKSQPIPREIAAYWIEHVLEFGGEHLRSTSQDMPVYEFLMLDILLYGLLSVLVLMYLLRLCVIYLVKPFCFMAYSFITNDKVKLE